MLALMLSIVLHILFFVILTFTVSDTAFKPRLSQEEELKRRLIVIQDIMTRTDRPPDDEFVWSDADHFVPEQKEKSFEHPKRAEKPEPKQDTGKGFFSSLKRFFEIPTSSETAGIVGDDVENILNSRKYKHYSFFKRVFEKLYPMWTGELRQRRSAWERHTSGDYLTRIRLRMNKLGYISTTDVLRGSGVQAFDEAAVKAITGSQPFPNPPQDFAIAPDEYEFIYEFLFQLSASGFQFRMQRKQ